MNAQTPTTKGRTANRKPIGVDLHVAAKLLEMRQDKNWTQNDVADELTREIKAGSSDLVPGSKRVSYQQIQKYESGTNRISSGLLWYFARIFGVPIAAFYAGFDPNEQQSSG